MIKLGPVQAVPVEPPQAVLASREHLQELSDLVGYRIVTICGLWLDCS
jgi:hypothetical protein